MNRTALNTTPTTTNTAALHGELPVALEPCLKMLANFPIRVAGPLPNYFRYFQIMVLNIRIEVAGSMFFRYFQITVLNIRIEVAEKSGSTRKRRLR
jgi:hypothetical protein